MTFSNVALPSVNNKVSFYSPAEAELHFYDVAIISLIDHGQSQYDHHQCLLIDAAGWYVVPGLKIKKIQQRYRP